MRSTDQLLPPEIHNDEVGEPVSDFDEAVAQHMAIEETHEEDLNAFEIEKPNPFKKAFATKPQPLALKPKTSPKQQVLVESYTGELIAPELYAVLEQAYQQADKPHNTKLWLAQNAQGDIEPILTETPQESGYKAYTMPLPSLSRKILGYSAQYILGWPIRNQALIFPNGGELPLNPLKWINADGKPVDVFQVIGLPDNTWLKIARINLEEHFDSNQAKQIRECVENHIAEVEAEGKIRQTVIIPKSQEVTAPDTEPVHWLL